jgi:hypothetical protein
MSPDLTSREISFWRYVKDHVYMNKIRDLNQLKARTSEAAGQVTRYVLQHVRTDVEYRLDTCRVTDDAHVVTYELL